MTEIDKKNLKNYLYFTFGITYIAWGILAIFTQSYIFGLETFIGRTLHIIGALGPAIASGFYLKSNNIKFKHFLFNKRENSSIYFIIHMLAILILFSVSSLELNGVSIYLMPLFFIQIIFFGGGHEELGWRGILQPLLDKKYTYWQSNLIVGSIWGIWHLPLWFIVGESHQGFPFILFCCVKDLGYLSCCNNHKQIEHKKIYGKNAHVDKLPQNSAKRWSEHDTDISRSHLRSHN